MNVALEVCDVLCVYGIEGLSTYEAVRPWLLENPERTFLAILEEEEEISVFISSGILNDSQVHICHVHSEEVLKQLAWEYLFLHFAYVSDTPVAPDKAERREQAFAALKRWQCGVSLLASDYSDLGVKVVRNMRRNANRLIDSRHALDLKGCFAALPAVICGAGPSLDQNIEHLACMRDKALLFAGGSALSALLAHGITPHFSAAVDPDPPLERYPKTLETPFFYPLRVASEILARARGPLLYVPSNGGYPIEKNWVCSEETFDGGWNVVTTLIAIAYHLGCTPIILVGVDLSSAGQQLYASGVVQDEPPVTKRDWLQAVEWIKTFVSEHSSCRWVHTSPIAQLQGMEKMSLADLKLHSIHALDNRIRCAIDALPLLEMGKGICEEDLTRCLEICEKMLQTIEKNFPTPAFEKGEFVLLELDLEDEVICRDLLVPLWEVWRHVLCRKGNGGNESLHKILFFKRVLETHLENFHD